MGGSSLVWTGFLVGSIFPDAGGWQVLLYGVTVFCTFYLTWIISRQVRRRLVPLHPKSDSAYQYKKTVAAFEDWWIRTKAEHWQRLSGLKFERELARLFNAIGWEAKATRASGDQGIDIEAKIDGERLIVQCKAHNKPVTPNVARELYGTLAASGAKSAILASVSGFGPGVHDFISNKPIMLIDLPWILEKQQSLDFKRMPVAVRPRQMERWIQRVIPKASSKRGSRHRGRSRRRYY